MISNHFPSTFGHEYPWLILAMLSLGSAGIKHYFNLREKGQLSVWDPGSGAPCYQCVFPEAPAEGLAPTCAQGAMPSP